MKISLVSVSIRCMILVLEIHRYLCVFCNCRQPPHQRRVGGVFLKYAPRVKELYMAYSANHPQAAAILQNKR